MRGSFSSVGVSAVAVALVLAGCGEAVPGHERLAGAAERTQQENTAHLTVDSRLEQTGEAGGPLDIAFTGEGQVDFAAERLHLAMQLPGRLGDQRMETIHDGDVVYVRPPVPDAEQRWVRYDLDGQDPAIASMEMGGFGGPMGDPTAVLTAATRPVGDIEELGHEEIREVATSGYGFDVGMLDLLELDAGSAGAQHLEDLEVEVAAWLDREDRVRRLRMSFDLASMNDGMVAWARAQDEQAGEPPPRSTSPAPEGTFTTTIEWFEFGEPVDITIPDEDDLVDEDTLRAEMTDSASASAQGEATDDMSMPDDVIVDEAEGDVESSERRAQEKALADPSAEQLWGRTFVSVAVTEDGQPRADLGKGRIEVSFVNEDGDRLMRWWEGCVLQGTDEPTIDAERIAIDDIWGWDGTQCEPDADDIDWLNAFFSAGPYWQLDGDRLTLTAGPVVIEMVEGEPSYFD